MNRVSLTLALVVLTATVNAQTAPKSAASGSAAAKPTTTSTATKASSATANAAASPWLTLPPGVPKVIHGPVKIAIAARYEDIKLGTGPEPGPNKMWHIKYTGWRAADGVKFDSWDEHPQPVIGKDGKPELGPDGKPKMGDPQPLAFPQGMGRLIPGFDYAVAGMHIGGKRRIFVPWQLAYGTRAIPDRPDHPGIPAKSDLIFDIELVEVTDLPTPPAPPVMPAHPAAGAPGAPPVPGATPKPSAPPAAAPGAATPRPTAQPSAPATPPPATAPATTQPESK